MLDFPKEQKPGPHTILHYMLIADQNMNRRLGNSGQAWSLLPSVTLTTVIGQNQYTIAQPIEKLEESGKVYFVTRSTNNVELPYVVIPYDDFNSQEFGRMPQLSVNNSLEVPEKIIFYRTNMQNQTRFVVLQPTPREVLTYNIWFHTGAVDRQGAPFTSSAQVTELADWSDVWVTKHVALSGACEWEECDRETKDATQAANIQKAKMVAAGANEQLSEMADDVQEYIDQMNDPVAEEIPYWNQYY